MGSGRAVRPEGGSAGSPLASLNIGKKLLETRDVEIGKQEKEKKEGRKRKPRAEKSDKAAPKQTVGEGALPTTATAESNQVVAKQDVGTEPETEADPTQKRTFNLRASLNTRITNVFWMLEEKAPVAERMSLTDMFERALTNLCDELEEKYNAGKPAPQNEHQPKAGRRMRR